MGLDTIFYSLSHSPTFFSCISHVWLLPSPYEGKALCYSQMKVSLSDTHWESHQKVTRFADFAKCDETTTEKMKWLYSQRNQVFVFFIFIFPSGWNMCWLVTHYMCFIIGSEWFKLSDLAENKKYVDLWIHPD